MFTPSQTTQSRHAVPKRPRRGVALVFVLIFVIAMAALAMSSIFMASNANLLAKSYDRERDLKFAAELALSIGKSRVNADPSILTMRTAGQVDTIILNHATLTGANGQPLAGIYVNVYVGPTGSTSGQFGRFSSIVAEARDQDRKELRAIQAVYQNQAIPGPILTLGNIDLSGALEPHWGPVMAQAGEALAGFVQER